MKNYGGHKENCLQPLENLITCSGVQGMCLKYLRRRLLDIGNDNEGSKDFKSPMLESGASLVTALKFQCVGLRRERFNSSVL